jgi:hypothetical protein
MRAEVPRSLDQVDQRATKRGTVIGKFVERRRTFEEYRAVARRAWSLRGADHPTWVSEVTGCFRGLSCRLARAFNM